MRSSYRPMRHHLTSLNYVGDLATRLRLLTGSADHWPVVSVFLSLRNESIFHIWMSAHCEILHCSIHIKAYQARILRIMNPA